MPFLIAGGVLSLVVLVLVVLVVRARAACDAELAAAAEQDDEDANPIHKLAARIVEDAYTRGASSIHIGARGHVEEDGHVERRFSVRYRVDGALDERMQVPAKAIPALIARFSHMAGLPQQAQGRLEEGRIEFRRFSRKGLDVDLGVARWGAAGDERCVLQLKAKGSISLDLEALDLSPDDAARLRRATGSKQGGVILVAGGVKSGRTTTLYSLRQELEEGRAIVDVARDEYFPCVDGVDARNVSSLDADVVVVNDLDTPALAQLAFQAAQGGKLVLASLFADDVGVAISRLAEDFGVSRHVLGACLRAVSAQRLCRRLCSACPAGAPSAACERCKGTGYKGRLALYEVAEVKGALLDAVRSGETSADLLHAAAIESGMTTLADDGARKVALGRTSASEVGA